MELDTKAMLEDREERLKNLRKSNATQLGWIIVLILVIAGLVIALIVTNVNKEDNVVIACNGIEQVEHSTYINASASGNYSSTIYATEFALKINNEPMETAKYVVYGNEASFEVRGSEPFKIQFKKKVILPGDVVQLYFRGKLIATL